MMRKNKYKLTLLTIFLGFVSFCVIVNFDAHLTPSSAQTPLHNYDLLFLSSTPTRWWPASERSYEINLYLFDTETREITLIKTEDLPLSFNALSPDGQHLAVLRETQLCFVDSHLQTEFCLPPDMVDVSYGSKSRIFWEADSRSFWSVLPDDETLLPTLVQISIPNGSILNTVQLEDNPAASSRPAHVENIYPEVDIVVLFDGASYRVYDLESGDFLYYTYADAFPSPDGQLLAIVDNEIGFISNLDDISTITYGTPIQYINSQSAWSETPELVWAGGRPFQFFWSHDGQKIAFRRILGYRDDGVVATTSVYFLETQEIRVLAQDYLEGGYLIWSPDDTMIAQALTFGAGGGTDLSIITLEGDTFPIITDLSDGLPERREVFSTTWLPHGWLQFME